MSAQRVAVVTGGNKGIGFAIVRALCKKFSGIVYLTARDLDRGTTAVKSLEKEGLKAKFHLLDVANQQSIDTLKEYLVKNYGGIDVLIHNAGIMYGESSVPYGEQVVNTVAVNFTGTVNICNTFLPIIKSNGRLVNLSSSLMIPALAKCNKENQDFFKSPDLTEEKLIKKLNDFVASAQTEKVQQKGFASSAYGMSKLGVTAFTRILGKRVRLENNNILVNSCCPGWVKTALGGTRAPLTPDQGAETPLYLALLQDGATEPNGEFVKEKKVFKWY